MPDGPAIASFVRAVAPKDKRAVQSVETWRIVLTCAGMVALTDWNASLQARTTLLLLVNVFTRLWWPSQYYPASRSAAGVHASPVTHRCIAFCAEFHMYEVWAVWAGVPYWGDATRLWLMVLIGECTSTTGVLLQSELLQPHWSEGPKSVEWVRGALRSLARLLRSRVCGPLPQVRDNFDAILALSEDGQNDSTDWRFLDAFGRQNSGVPFGRKERRPRL